MFSEYTVLWNLPFNCTVRKPIKFMCATLVQSFKIIVNDFTSFPDLAK
jgi:hypothetical protein